METKANYAIVGFFTVLVMAAAFGFVYWMSQYGRSGDMAQLAIRIPGSANGLSIGSPVRFNGIPVGSVRSLAIDADDPRFSVAMTEVATSAPVKQSTSAVLDHLDGRHVFDLNVEYFIGMPSWVAAGDRSIETIEPLKDVAGDVRAVRQAIPSARRASSTGEDAVSRPARRAATRSARTCVSSRARAETDRTAVEAIGLAPREVPTRPDRPSRVGSGRVGACIRARIDPCDTHRLEPFPPRLHRAACHAATKEKPTLTQLRWRCRTPAREGSRAWLWHPERERTWPPWEQRECVRDIGSKVPPFVPSW